MYTVDRNIKMHHSVITFFHTLQTVTSLLVRCTVKFKYVVKNMV